MIVGYQMAEHQDYSLVDRTVKAAVLVEEFIEYYNYERI